MLGFGPLLSLPEWGAFMRVKTSQFKEISIRGDACLTTVLPATRLKQDWCPLFCIENPPFGTHTPPWLCGMEPPFLYWVWFGCVTRVFLLNVLKYYYRAETSVCALLGFCPKNSIIRMPPSALLWVWIEESNLAWMGANLSGSFHWLQPCSLLLWPCYSVLMIHRSLFTE